MKEQRYYDPEYDRFVTEETIKSQYKWFAEQEWFHKSYEQFKEENFYSAEVSDAMLREREEMEADMAEMEAEMEDRTMKNNATKINFRHDGVIYTTEKEGYYYAQPIGGIKKRIAKDAFNKAYTAYVNGQISDEEWQTQADADKEQQEIAKQAKFAEDEKAVLGDAPKATEEAQEQQTGEQPSEKKEAPKKAKKAPRKSKDIAYTHKFGAETLTLTAKQVDFIKHIPDTNFYEHGLESILYCDILADEIGGQFAGKPMTTGAMISTLREKGLIDVGVDRVNGRKCKIMSFTPSGKDVARALGLK